MPGFPLGEIGEMKNKEHAQMWVDEGYAEYVNEEPKNEIVKIPKKEVKIEKIESKFEIKYEKLNIHPIKVILKRNSGYFVQVFAGDDKKKGGKPIFRYFKIEENNFDKIITEAETLNYGDNGVFYNINPLSHAERKKDNVVKIKNIFIDLDEGATDEDNELVLMALKEYGFSYYYNAKSGHGFHILIPIDLDTEKITLVKGFLTYLKENICNKIDIATHTNERLMRFPESWHNKDEKSKQLKTLLIREPTEEEVIQNNENIVKYQLEQKKGVKDIQYQNSIVKQDIFFTEILNNKNKWFDIFKELNNNEQLYIKTEGKQGKGNNQIFNKNLAIFATASIENYNLAKQFMLAWNNLNVTIERFDFFYNKVKNESLLKKNNDDINKVNYHELLKWSKENNMLLFIELLEKQTQTSFLDTYEIYYLEDEKPENAYLLYYPVKNYYVQKALNDVLMTIYYDTKENNINIIEEFDFKLIDDWDNFSFKKQLDTILKGIHKRLDNENRIKKVFNINYKPNEDKFIYINNKKYFNTYVPSKDWNYFKQSENYSFPAIKKLIWNLTGEEEANYNYFNKWLAWIIQNPTQKLPTAIILQGKQGSGKGTLRNLILGRIFGENCIEINQTHLESSFNDYLLGKQIIVANEVMHNENRQTLPNVLKNLVTDEEITINRKFLKSINSKNYTHWIFCTNNDNPIKIDVDDRRYSVFYSEKLAKGIVKEIIHNHDYEIENYISYLKSLKVEFEEVSEPIMTDAKAEIIELNKDSTERFFEVLKSYPSLDKAYLDIVFSLDRFKIISKDDGKKYLTSESFYYLYEQWCERTKEKGIFNKQNFSKRLSSKGLKNKPQRDGELHRAYDLDMIKNKLLL